MIRSGVRVSGHRSTQDLVKDLVPEPDPQIVKRLISYYSPRFSIRAPWDRSSNVPSYDLENVKFYARILTMLKDLSIFPPPILQSQGGVPSRIFNSFDGPLLFTPSGQQSQRYLAVPNSPEEVKANAVSNQPGGLADAAEGMVPEIEFAGREQVIELRQLWRDAHYVPPPETKYVVDDLPALDNDEFGEVNLDDVTFDDFLRTQNMENPLPFDSVGSVFDLENNMEPFEFQIVRPAMNWSQRIRRRLPWTTFSNRRRQEIELELSPVTPAFTISDEDLEEPNVQQEIPAATRSAWLNMTPTERQRRWNFIRLVASYLLLPTVILWGGSALHKNLESKQVDPLVQLYYNLPTKNWFKSNFTALDWAYMINITDRTLNFQFLAYVVDVINFHEDAVALWVSAKYIGEQNQTLAKTWFEILRNAILFRGSNSIAKKQQTLFTGFEWCYILQQVNPNSRNVLVSFVDSKIAPSKEVQAAVKEAKRSVLYESKTVQRFEKFEHLVSSLQAALRETTETQFYSPWIKAMNTLYRASYFFETFSSVSWQTLLYDVSVRPQLYPLKTQQHISDFLHRFQRSETQVSPFNDLDTAMKFVEDPSREILQVLGSMNSYQNDGQLDSFAYEILNKHFAEHGAVSEMRSFSESVQSLNLPQGFPVEQALQLLSAVNLGIVGFLEKIETDLNDVKELPDTLPSVSLWNNGVDHNYVFESYQIVVPGRNLLGSDVAVSGASLANWIDLPFVRTAKYVLTVVKDKMVAAIETLDNGRRWFNFVIFDRNKIAILQKPITVTNSEEYDGKVLKDYWVSREIDFILGTGATLGTILLTDHLLDLDVGVPLLKIGADVSKTVLLTYAQMPFKQQVVIGGVGALTAVYGPTKVIEKTVEVVEGVVSAGPGILFVGLGVGGLLLASSFSNKRQKLF